MSFPKISSDVVLYSTSTSPIGLLCILWTFKFTFNLPWSGLYIAFILVPTFLLSSIPKTVDKLLPNTLIPFGVNGSKKCLISLGSPSTSALRSNIGLPLRKSFLLSSSTQAIFVSFGSSNSLGSKAIPPSISPSSYTIPSKAVIVVVWFATIENGLLNKLIWGTSGVSNGIFLSFISAFISANQLSKHPMIQPWYPSLTPISLKFLSV